MKIPIPDLLVGVAGTLGILLLVAAALDFAYGRLGEGRTEFDRRGFAFAALLTVLGMIALSWDSAAWPGQLWALGFIIAVGLKTKFYRRGPKSTASVADPDFGSLEHDGHQWVGNYDTGGPEPTGVLLAAGKSGPSAQQRRQFLDFRAAYPALEARIVEVIDPYGTAPPGDWWLVYVDLARKVEADVIELTYESRSSQALRSIELRGDLRDPVIVDMTNPELTRN